MTAENELFAKFVSEMTLNPFSFFYILRSTKVSGHHL